MQFVYPAFLWALSLLVIPVILHLFNFRRYKTVKFSNVAMLKKIETESRKTKQLKRWLVLLSRILALAALVLAFAQPYFPQTSKASGAALKTFYIDNSFSMYAIGENGQLFEQAKNVARDLISGLEPADQIVLMDNALDPSRIMNKAQALEAVDQLQVSQQINDLPRILSTAAILRTESDRKHNLLYYISDMQQTVELMPIEADSTLSIMVAKLRPTATQNLSIDSVWLDAPIHKKGDQVKLRARISNRGDAAQEAVGVVLEVNGRQRGAETLSIGASRAMDVELVFTAADTGFVPCRLSLDDPEIFFDNALYFNLYVKPNYRVLVLSTEAGPFSAEGLFSSDDQFDLVTASPLETDHSEVFKFDLVILGGLSTLSSAWTGQLLQFVEQGGVCIIAPSQEASTLNTVLTSLQLPTYRAPEEKDLRIDPSALRSAFFEGVYGRIPDQVKMPMVHRLYKVNRPADMTVILRTKDGAEVLMEKTYGKGKMFQLTVPTERSWSDLVDHELFVLLCLQSAFSKISEQALYYNLDFRESIPLHSRVNDRAISLRTEDQEVVVETGAQNGRSRIWLNDLLQVQGHYVVGEKAGQDSLALLSLNHNRRESVQKYYDNDELMKWYGKGLNVVEATGSQEVVSKLKQSGNGALWKVFVLISLIFLLIEILLLRFIKS